MASWQMRAVALYVRATRKKRYATREAGLAFLHSAKGPSDPPAKALGDSRVSTHRVRGRDVHVVRGPGHTASAAGAVVYLHGGAYTNEVVDQQWAFVAALAARTGVEVHVPIYGLAPHHTASEAVDLVAEVVHGLVAQGRSVVLLGDSAGGGLALVAAQQAAPAVRQRVAGLLLIAPWIDLTMANPAVDAVEPTDPWLTRAGLHPIARSWAGDLALDDPVVSPLFGDLTGLPPVEVWVGTRDITAPDCRELERRMPDGAAFALHVEDGAIHDYPLLPTPEGRAASREIGERVTALLTASG
ncbi:MAG TPA: alpha/beta hydrolase [Ornithinibacter sp.]|jgi:monoterpene epsilon-lactone hydrolase|uniref:alpha/beta hydrolase n=1 Tax=Ornithinibacter sp. TaxID=2862748 RepID=UPI002CC0C7BC|nr:alpha/beta hydrolase [Ornithinibacter sp.]HNV40605.1 alpha/beta hydrolase [Ornithinibacter sp.]HOB79154.1 alpha/beta hydrolase [Ornithinibacter sp.]HOT55665.1 alpha/beta hydrolase [Ornithinibacter sp.]HPV88970.1 alpha/beta hydrolase [Ornithinibacter sp.]HQA12754.1 alpha/beta hydrolase [Ornithinibacter sp.]